MRGLILKSKYGDAIQNPLVSIVRKAASDMVRYASEFGLTPAARSRIAAGVRAEREESKFAGLLAG
jgi:P27 family predicted phage terminase small subunit